MSIETLATFFGWCAVINIGAILIFTLIMSALDKDGVIIELSVKIFGNTKEEDRPGTDHDLRQSSSCCKEIVVCPQFLPIPDPLQRDCFHIE